MAISATPSYKQPLDEGFRQRQFQEQGAETLPSIGQVELPLPDDNDPLPTRRIQLETMLWERLSVRPEEDVPTSSIDMLRQIGGAILRAWAVRLPNDPFPTVHELEARQ